jgi:hypothetical protein
MVPEDAPRLLAPTGYPRSGKDLAAEHLYSQYKGIRLLTFSDPIIKEANALLAEEGQLSHHRIDQSNKSHLPYRQLLQWVGNYRRKQDPEYWVKVLQSQMEAYYKAGARSVIFTGARAPEEVQWLRSLGGHIWRVIRPHNPYHGDAPIERALDYLPLAYYDAVLYNDREGDLNHYLLQAEACWHGLHLRLGQNLA